MQPGLEYPVSPDCRAAGKYICKRLNVNAFRISVIRCLPESGYAADRMAFIDIAGSFSAPWRPVGHHTAFLNAEGGVVVIEQPCPREVLEPQCRMSALSGPAAAEEKEGPAIQYDN